MRETADSNEVNSMLGSLVCSHSIRTPKRGFPINSLGVHLCNMFKLGYLEHVQHKSVAEQLEYIRDSISNNSFNPFLSVNRFYSYLEMGMYSHAIETAKYLDRYFYMDMESQFLEQEVDALKEGTALYDLVNLNSRYYISFIT